MTTKTDVKTFINKVEYKAARSLDERYQESVKAEITKAIELNPQLKANILSAEKGLRSLIKSCKEIQAITSTMGNIGKNTWDVGLKSLINDIDRESYQDMVTASFSRIIPDTPELNALTEAHNEETKKVKEAYRVLTYNAEGMTPTKAVKYLASVGFDVTWFGEDREKVIKAVDTTQLFVCGENS